MTDDTVGAVKGFIRTLCVAAVITCVAVSVPRDASASLDVTPKTPTALATSPSGALYVVDTGRDQILRRLGNGLFQVVAGNGHRGFSGDGGAATHAEISVENQSGLAVSSNGTLYFIDNGNGRIREILPNGLIETVAGGGGATLATSPVKARRVDFVHDQLNGLALGPGGELYLAADGVFRLDNGTLHWVIGSVAPRLNKGFRGYGMNPVVQKDFDPAYALSFDGRGDLLVGGGNTWDLYERVTSGALRLVEGDRAEGGYYAALAEAPDGDVVVAGGMHGLAWFHPSGSITPIAVSGLSTILPPPSHFAYGEAAAVGPNGAVYLDTVASNGYSDVGAIVEITPSGRATLLWKS